MINFLKKYAEQDSSEISFIKGWKDEYGSMVVIIDIDGEKECFTGGGREGADSWNFCRGIGAEKHTVSSSKPAGVGHYLVGGPIQNGRAEALTEVVNENKDKLGIIANNSGAAWEPVNESQKIGLQQLIRTYSQINSELLAIELLYSEGDVDTYDKNTEADVAKWKLPGSVVAKPTTPAAVSNVAPTTQSTGTNGQARSISSNSIGIFGNITPRWNGKNGYTLGPQYHQARARGDWYSDNAWDIEGSTGTQVFSLSCGTVSKMYESGTGNPKIYGTQISISGDSGYPSVFYTHLEGASIKVGDRVEVGTPIAKIKMPLTKGMPPHVHVGLSSGAISDLVTESGKFITREDKSISGRARLIS